MRARARVCLEWRGGACTHMYVRVRVWSAAMGSGKSLNDGKWPFAMEIGSKLLKQFAASTQ